MKKKNMDALTAKQIRDLSAEELKLLIMRGIIKAVPTGPLPRKVEDTPEYKRFLKFAGVEIAVNEAAQKYDIPKQTISRWKDKKLIKVIRQEGQRVLLDESYVAYCVYVYRKLGGQGKWAFNPDGTPRPAGVNLRKTTEATE